MDAPYLNDFVVALLGSSNHLVRTYTNDGSPLALQDSSFSHLGMSSGRKLHSCL